MKIDQILGESAGNVGDAIVSLYDQIYELGDDAVDHLYHNAPLFAQFWDQYEGDINSIVAEVSPKNLIRIKQELEAAAKQEGLMEFAPAGDNDGDRDPEDVLFRFAKMWYSAPDVATQRRVEQALAKIGWEIGELESEEGGAFVMRIGDDAGDSYIGWSEEDLAGLDEQGVAEGSEAQDNLVSILNSFDYYSDNGKVYVNDAGDKIARQGSNWKHQSGKVGHGSEELGNFLSSKKGVAEGLNEFAPAGGGGNIPRGPKTPKRGPWDDSGEDPYQLRRYNRSIDFFDQFDSDGVDKQKFDKATGEYEGYYFDRDAASGITQIAYFKFDDPTKIGDDDPGVGWYYEPIDEGVAEGNIPNLRKYGQEVPSTEAAIDAFSNGDRVFLFHEMDNAPFEAPDIETIANYSPEQILVVPSQGIAEAPGAETLAHNQSTVTSNEKAFDLEEGKDKKPEQPEADYGDDYQAMVSRVKKLAGLGPLKTVYDPNKRVYKNVPTAVQPKK